MMTETTVNVRVALPLTTKEAHEAFVCPDCKDGDHDCVESATTSQSCKDCGERIWMQDYGLALKPTEFPCPYCHKRQRHMFAEIPTLNDSAFCSPIYSALREKAPA